jgi:hypothetical protein
MIIVKLMGGLGNQMFQYAAGRRLAHVHKTELKLDVSWFSEIAAIDTKRKYELAPFNLSARFASSEEIAKCKGPELLRRIAWLFPTALPFFGKRHVYEKYFHFDPAVLTLSDNVYLEGYWQCPRYFEDIEDIIRNEFTVTPPPDATNRAMAEEIARSESVSVHVRRGDYVSNPSTNEYHGVCSLEYYQAAVKSILNCVSKPHFFIFSDDPVWAKKNLSVITPHTVIDRNGPDKAYEDMRLMSLCKHHIIANSSFSWWGAWLSKNPEKIVIAPKHWFKDPKIDARDLVPETWKRI